MIAFLYQNILQVQLQDSINLSVNLLLYEILLLMLLLSHKSWEFVCINLQVDCLYVNIQALFLILATNYCPNAFNVRGGGNTWAMVFFFLSSRRVSEFTVIKNLPCSSTSPPFWQGSIFYFCLLLFYEASIDSDFLSQINLGINSCTPLLFQKSRARVMLEFCD